MPGVMALTDHQVARPGDRVRGRRLPQPVGVLGRRHRLHGARRALHEGLRVLPRGHPQAAAACRRRAGAPPPPSSRWARSPRAHDGRPRRSPGRRMAHVAACVRAIRNAALQLAPRRWSPTRRRWPSLELLSSPPAPTCSTTTSRRLLPAAAPCARRPAMRSLGAGPRKAAGLVAKTGFMIGLGERDEEIDGLLADSRWHRRRHRDGRPISAPDVQPQPGGSLGRAGCLHRLEAARRTARHRPRRGQPADPFVVSRQVRRRQRPLPARLTGGRPAFVSAVGRPSAVAVRSTLGRPDSRAP